MKRLWKLISYLMIAVLASMVTMAVTAQSAPPQSKLDQLEQLLLEKFIGEADQTAMEDAAADAMVAAMGDRWSYYIPADEYSDYKDRMDNSYVGIGITIQVTDDGQGFLVTKVNENGPADQAGMLPEDRLIGVDGVDVREMTADETSKLVKGEENTTVVITINRNGTEMELPVVRMRVETPVATWKMLKDNVGLVTIVNFDTRCAEETIAAIEALLAEGAQKLIFDVRFNPGGYAHELVAVLDYILPAGDLFRTVDYLGNEKVDKSDENCLTGIPMAVLVNGDSFSAAEFFAAALREYDYAIVVGQPTTGKGYFQQTYSLNDGSAVGVSVGKYFTPLGRSLAEEGGLVPDVVEEIDEELMSKVYAGILAPEKDPQIQAAIKALK